MMGKDNKGFTMIEILAVVVILGILMAVAVPMVSRYITKSRNTSYNAMEESLYYGAKNYVLDENMYVNKCSSGYSDIEDEDDLLVKFQYVENLIDPVDKSKQCSYNVYACMENEPSMDVLPTYKYKIQLDCLDYTNCTIYREDGTKLPCEDTIDDTDGPTCGIYTASNTEWNSVDSVSVELSCVANASGRCAQETYNQTFTSEGKTANIEIKDIFGNKSICAVDVYIDRTPPETPVINNPYENIWTNESYSIQISSSDDLSGIEYFEYRYPDSAIDSEREWKLWADSSKVANDSTPFTTTKFSLERNEYVEVRACDYAGNCSNTAQSMIKIDKTIPEIPVLSNDYNGVWAGAEYVNANKYIIGVTSSDSASGIKYYQYRYPNSENVWYTYANSAEDSFTTTPFTIERNEIVEIRSCDYAGNCSLPAQNTIMIDKTAPTCSISLTGTVGTDGIYNSVVTVSLEPNDPGASSKSEVSYGLANNNTVTYNGITSGTQDVTDGITWYGFIEDAAGNAGTCNSGNFKVVLRSIPEFTYTGKYEIVDDNDNTITNLDSWTGDWKIRFLSSGTITFTKLNGAENGIDVFLVGGGGNGGGVLAYRAGCYGYSAGGGGGGGGYRTTARGVSVSTTSYSITVGAAKGTSKAFGYSAAGGSDGTAATDLGSTSYSGKGGSGGSAGGTGGMNGTSGKAGVAGGYEFGESTYSKLYGGGGGGGHGHNGENGAIGYFGAGGAGGGGHGNGKYWGYSSGQNGEANTGGGGGGASYYLTQTNYYPYYSSSGYTWVSGTTYSAGTGGSGIVIIRNKR